MKLKKILEWPYDIPLIDQSFFYIVYLKKFIQTHEIFFSKFDSDLFDVLITRSNKVLLKEIMKLEKEIVVIIEKTEKKKKKSAKRKKR